MHSHYKLMILLLVAAVMISPLLFGAPINPVHAPHAMVVSQHELASRAGVEIMQAGGNAVDASVATGFALAVVHPPAGNLGGGGFMLLRTADGNVHFIDYREKAPAAAIQKGGGLTTAGDLGHYEVKERKPIRGTYRGYEIISAPPPSSGGIALLEILNILEGYDLAKLGNRSAQSVHVTLEAFRRAFFDRAEFLGDPDFSKIPVAQLIDKRYAAAWRESINPDHASASKELKRPQIFSQLEQYAAVYPQAAAIHEPVHTTHYSVVDPAGNTVSVTTTLNDDFGSRVTAEGLGFLLNDEMDDFAAKPGVPNIYGLIQGPANAIGPGKRPLSAMTPTIVLKDGK